jgi:hypothetical protein
MLCHYPQCQVLLLTKLALRPPCVRKTLVGETVRGFAAVYSTTKEPCARQHSQLRQLALRTFAGRARGRLHTCTVRDNLFPIRKKNF